MNDQDFARIERKNAEIKKLKAKIKRLKTELEKYKTDEGDKPLTKEQQKRANQPA